MAALFLTTKLYIPSSRPNLIRRERLLRYLDDGLALGRKLTLVSAPAGFGKTTLISEWVHYRAETFPPCRCAWMTLDQGDNRLSHFLAYLVAAFQKIDANLGQDLIHALQLPQSPPAAVVLTELLNQVAAHVSDDPHAHYLLVLDEYQAITEPTIHEAVTFLLEQLPSNWHLVLTTRSDPALPLARLRARGQLTEIRAADLRFTTAETTTYLRHVTNLDYAPSEIDTLTARTEGWIAGLQLFSLLIQEATRRQSATSPATFIRNFTGTHRYIIDYLTDEVLNQQPPDRRDFLLHTSILERLTADLCDVLLASKHSQAILELLETHNLFLTSLDEQRQWYRYHHLFADLLQTRLHEEVGAAEIAALHLRASQWFEQQQFIGEALRHALAAADFTRAVTLVATHAMPTIRRGAITTVQDWLRALPAAQIRAHPRLCIAQAWVFFHTHKADEIEPWVKAAEAALQQPPFVDAPNRSTLVEHVLALRISVAELRQEHSTVLQLAQAALARIGNEGHSARGTNLYFLGRALCNLGETSRGIEACRASIPCFQAAGIPLAAMGATSDLALFLLQQGKLQMAQTTLEDALRWTAKEGLLATPAAAQLYMVLGYIYYERNELATAAEQLQQSIQLAKYMLPLTASLAHLGHAQVLLAQGDPFGATAALQEAEQLVAHLTIVPPESTLLDTRRVRIWLQQEDFAAVAQWIGHSALSVDEEPVYGNEQELITLARALVTRGCATSSIADLQQAATLLAQLERAVRRAGRTGHLLDVLILQALVLEAQGHSQAALVPLTEVLQIAEPEGYLRLFCDEGPKMQHLLTRWQQQTATQPFPKSSTLGTNPERDGQQLAAYVSRLQHIFATDGPATSVVSAMHPSAALQIATHLSQPLHHTSGVERSDDELAEPLSPRELEVLRLIGGGLDNTEIASELTIAVSTVKTHINRIFAKLAVRSRTQAVAHARKLQLLP